MANILCFYVKQRRGRGLWIERHLSSSDTELRITGALLPFHGMFLKPKLCLCCLASLLRGGEQVKEAELYMCSKSHSCPRVLSPLAIIVLNTFPTLLNLISTTTI